MPLIKSKINSLAWLKSAIYFSVVGGVVLSSLPVLAATFSVNSESETFVSLTVKEDIFGNTASPIRHFGEYWTGTFNVEEIYGNGNPDELVVRVYLQHIKSLHHSDLGKTLNLNFRVGGLSGNLTREDSDVLEHGVGHSDLAGGYLTIETPVNPLVPSKWQLDVAAYHKVPEPTTMFGTALALGWGGWLKRKNSIKQNKTKSQG